MRPGQILAAFASLSALSTAWPWPGVFEDTAGKAVQGIEGMLYRRQNSAASTNQAATSATEKTSATGKTTGTDKATTGKTTATGKTTGSSSPKNTDSASASGTDSAAASSGASASGSGASKTSGKAAATTEYDPRLPAGGIQMVTPAAISGSQYYKVGDFVTLAWNYTSLSVTPTAIDILASCSAAQATYTLALNQSVQETGKIIWDTGKFQKTATQQLLTNTYTLIIYDADSSISSTPKAGYLGVYDQFTFGMYTPQAYTPWNEFSCPTCSGAMTLQERQTLGFLFGMATITILSFTYFASGRFGVF